ncbi:ATP-binding protein [Methyloversatilis thermotolerans]|uniref:ATP-binding protein n=1 Tax=Methyloversatilis thermotolerans TaxID=1346290 RepID=UPI0003701E94|nr:ATP-binding protein [Methyloversatilis thermotolerans]
MPSRFGLNRLGFRSRVLLAAFLPSVAIAFALALHFTTTRMADIERSLVERAMLLVASLAPASEYGLFAGSIDILQSLADAALRERDVDGLLVMDGDRVVLARAGRVDTTATAGLDALTGPALVGSSETHYLFAAPVLSAQVAPDLLLDDDTAGAGPTRLGLVLLQMSRLETVRARRQLVLSAAFITLGGLVLAAVLARLLSDGVTSPIRQLADTVRRIEQGDFSARARTGARGILQGLEDGINRMAVTLSGARAELEQRVQVATAELQAQKERAEQASRAKTQFVDALLHDLSQPLMAMGLDIRTLKLRLQDDESAGLLTRLERSSLKLENMRDVLLDVARLESGATQPRIADFPLGRLFDSLRLTFEGQAAEKGLRLAFHPTSAWCRSDPLLLERVLANLVSNALRYTVRGTVLVGARRIAVDRVLIEVRDSGQGIPSDRINDVFEEFVRLPGVDTGAAGRGMGLGLAIVKRLCALLGHPLAVRSRPGVGSTFSVGVPRARAPEVAPVQDELPGLQRLRGRRVALIDDDAALLHSLRGLLQQLGIDVVSGESPDFVLRQLRQAGAPAFILSDYQLGDGNDGLAAVHSLRREFGEHLPAIIMTGLAATRELEIKLETHGIPLVAKPVRPVVLDAVVGSLLDAADPPF